jgi:hypothetical protein
MDTDMHDEAIPGADRMTLQNPADVARRLLSVLEEIP